MGRDLPWLVVSGRDPRAVKLQVVSQGKGMALDQTRERKLAACRHADFGLRSVQRGKRALN